MNNMTIEQAYSLFNKIHWKATCIYCSLFDHLLSEDEMSDEMKGFTDGYLISEIGNDWEALAMAKAWIKEGRPCLG